MPLENNTPSETEFFIKEYHNLMLQKLEIEVKKTNKEARKKSFGWTEFFMHIFPSILTIIPVIYGLWLLEKSNFFEIKNDLIEIKNVKLQNETLALEGRKSELKDSIELLRSALSTTTSDLQVKTRDYKKLSYQKDSLELNSKDMIKRACYSTYVDYMNGYLNIYDPSVETLMEKAAKNIQIGNYIRTLIQKDLYKKYNDSYSDIIYPMKAAAFAFMAFKESFYHAFFERELSRAIVFNRDYRSQYDIFFLRFLIWGKWDDIQKERNINILVDSGTNINNPLMMNQIAVYATSLLDSNFKPGHEYKFLPKIHKYLISELSVLINKNDRFLYRTDINNPIQFYKDCIYSYMTECPQCYFAFEAEIIKQGIVFLTEFDAEDIDSMTIVVKLADYGKAAIVADKKNAAIMKIAFLPRPYEINAFSNNLFKRYNSLKTKYNIPNIYDTAQYKKMKQFTTEFETYYIKNWINLKPWSLNSICDKICDSSVRRKIIHETFNND